MDVLEAGPKPEKKAEVVEETAEESAQAEA
jgi:hypothetical protein